MMTIAKIFDLIHLLSYTYATSFYSHTCKLLLANVNRDNLHSLVYTALNQP